MFNYIMGTALVIEWQDIGIVISVLISIFVFGWNLFKGFNSRVSKIVYKEDKKILEHKLESMKKEFNDIIIYKEEENIGSHIRLSQETERYYGILEKKFDKLINIIDSKLDILIKSSLTNGK